MKALFLGLGGVGQRHLRNLRHLVPDCAVAAVRSVGRAFEIGPDLKPDYTIDITAKYAISQFPDLATALRDFRPDLAVVASPTACHAAQTMDLIAAGVPTLLEKPVCVTGAELDQLLAATAATATPVVVAYMLRFNPSVARLRQAVADRVLGPVQAVELTANSFMPSWHPYEPVNGFYAGRKDLGGGAILTEVHLCDLLDAMFGLPLRLWTVGGHLSSYPLDVEDGATALMEYRMEGRPVPVTLAISFVQRPVKFGIVVKCEGGAITWNLLDNSLTIDDCRSGTRDCFAAPSFERNTMFIEEMSHFLAVVRGEIRAETALDKVAGGQRIALAMAQSLQTRTLVEF
jgi:predicted dehydrogenase